MTSSTADLASLGEHNFDYMDTCSMAAQAWTNTFLLAAIGKVAMNDWTHPWKLPYDSVEGLRCSSF